ncbi:2-carboxy-1,4-naphthoquinone phytyltransferase [Prochlorothrix hollandica]|uniref:2-carboxy-1,4-naphthoquinone phytyltransferase n=1 Tax=Prochlorothrix hollandica TaxID=1223 RepID=UPI00333EF2B0
MTSPVAVSVVGPDDRTPDRKKLWMAALKPPMYSVAIMPIWWGTALAYGQQHALNWGVFLVFMGSAILILAWENITNDVFDSETGIDINKAHSLVNLTQRKQLVFWLGNGCLALGILGIGAIAYGQQDPTVLGLVLGCCVLGYVYQGPPFRWGYQGLGEILCFFAFGPLAVGAAYHSQTHGWSWESQTASIVLGLTTSLILLCSHFHQVEDDVAAGKRSPIVRLGTQRGAQVVVASCLVIYGLILALALGGYTPLATLLSLAGVPAAWKLCRQLLRHHGEPAVIKDCKFIAVSLHFWSGLGFGLGFFLTY